MDASDSAARFSEVNPNLIEAWSKELSKTTVEHYIVQWSIEQFDYFPDEEPKPIVSPNFILASSDTKWHFALRPNIYTDLKPVFSLQRCVNDAGPPTVAVTYKLGFSHLDEETTWFDQQKLFDCARGGFDELNMPYRMRKRILVDDISHPDTLILICEMYILYEIDETNLLTDYDLANLSHDMLKLMKSEKFSDYLVKTLFGNFHVHKIILAARSPFFLKRFRNDRYSTEIDLNDISYFNIANLVSYMYTGYLNHAKEMKTPDIGFYECAKQFAVSELEGLLVPKYLYIRSIIAVEEFEFKWQIENFSKQIKPSGSFIESSPFIPYYGADEWTLILSNERAFPIKPLSIFVRATDRSEALRYVLEISLIDEHDVFQQTKRTTEYYQPNKIFGFPEFLEDFSSIHNYLKDDTLRIHCQLLFVVAKEMHDGHFSFKFSNSSKVPSLSKLSDDLRKILMSSEFADVTVKSDFTCIRAHKSILFARSKVLASMLLNEPLVDGILEIPDVDPDVVFLIIDHAYSGILKPLSTEDLVRLYRASEKYHCSSLSLISCQALGSHLNIYNFLEFAKMGDEYDSHLIVMTLIFAKVNWKEILSQTYWKPGVGQEDLFDTFVTFLVNIITYFYPSEKEESK